ncbi:MAG: RNA polymerase sigma factor, partial [Anaerolineales bacterium]
MSDRDLNNPPDSELVVRAQQGDRAAFGKLYTRYLTPIYRYLRSRLSDPRDAEDLTESAFLKAYQALPRYRERGWPFSAYLYQVARNALADHFRRQRPEVE